MKRHPYTYAADYIRSLASPNLSRSDASSIRSGIAKVLDIDDYELACKLSTYFQEHEEEITKICLRKILYDHSPNRDLASEKAVGDALHSANLKTGFFKPTDFPKDIK